MNVNRPIYLSGLRSEDEKGSLLHQPPLPPPPHHKVTPSILYIKKGKCFDIVLLIFLCLLFHEFLSVGTLQCFSCYNSHMQSPKT